MMHSNKSRGFTLIEISIALVIIGLTIGGIIVGQDLINSAAIRAQITQIDKYQAAVGAFVNKYNYLPGDIPNPYATNAGLIIRGVAAGGAVGAGTSDGLGDGNGIIQGNCNTATGITGVAAEECGELAVFWSDLSTAGLIDGTFPTSSNSGTDGYPFAGIGSYTVTLTSVKTTLYNWYPVAKVGGNNVFVYVMSFNFPNTNYFVISTITHLFHDIESTANPGVTVQQAYNIDTKIDDGLPQSGNVLACYVNYLVEHDMAAPPAGNNLVGANGGYTTAWHHCTPTTTATAYASTNCYDNNNVAGTQTYSIINNGNIPNCALSFKFTQ